MERSGGARISSGMEPLTLFFDGGCHLCSREIAWYRRKDVRGRLDYVDISSTAFDAASFGLDARSVRKEMHARMPDGSIAVGVPVFVAAWRELGFERLARFVEHPFVMPFARLGYAMFAFVRPYLPRRRCESDACAIR